MDKRFQVFVSSTYTDLREERAKVIQTLMEMDCIPAGMELFPAADEDQWNFIKRVIDDCDYYLLIIGGRYGSITDAGISYTEQEYDYAVDRGMRVIALVHSQPDDIPAGKTERSPDAAAKLAMFRKKVSTGRLVKFWSQPGELPGLVALSLSKTIKTYPAVGWIRANFAPNETLLAELNDLRKQNDEIKAQLLALQSKHSNRLANLAGLNEPLTLAGTLIHQEGTPPKAESAEWQGQTTWAELFSYLAPRLLTPTRDGEVRVQLGYMMLRRLGLKGTAPNVRTEDFHLVKVQLLAQSLISLSTRELRYGAEESYWHLTEQGQALMFELNTMKAGRSTPDA